MATVLISIEGEALRLQLFEFLNELGLQVWQSCGACEALELAEQPWAGIELLLADVPLPDGPRLAADVALRCPGLKLLLISSEPEEVNRALAPGAHVDFIEKPFAWRDLNRKLQKLLEPERVFELPPARSRGGAPQNARSAS